MERKWITIDESEIEVDPRHLKMQSAQSVHPLNRSAVYLEIEMKH